METPVIVENGNWIIIGNNGVVYSTEDRDDAMLVYNIMTGNNEEIAEYVKEYGLPFVERYTSIEWSDNLIIAEVSETRVEEN